MGDDAAVCEDFRKIPFWISTSNLVDDTIHPLVGTVGKEKPTLPDRELLVQSWNARTVGKINPFIISKLLGVFFLCTARQE